MLVLSGKCVAFYILTEQIKQSCNYMKEANCSHSFVLLLKGHPGSLVLKHIGYYVRGWFGKNLRFKRLGFTKILL